MGCTTSEVKVRKESKTDTKPQQLINLPSALVGEVCSYLKHTLRKSRIYTYKDRDDNVVVVNGEFLWLKNCIPEIEKKYRQRDWHLVRFYNETEMEFKSRSIKERDECNAKYAAGQIARKAWPIHHWIIVVDENNTIRVFAEHPRIINHYVELTGEIALYPEERLWCKKEFLEKPTPRSLEEETLIMHFLSNCEIMPSWVFQERPRE